MNQLYGYIIVPRGGHRGQRLDTGTLAAPTSVAAKLEAQRIVAPTLRDKSGLEVILTDAAGGNEIWPGPYYGPANA